MSLKCVALSLFGVAGVLFGAEPPTKPVFAPPVNNPVAGVHAAPPQDQGLPYTFSGRARGLEAIRPYIALFANAGYGSRYAYAQGHKIRLDDSQLLGDSGEALLNNGLVYVPSAFAGVLALKEIRPAPAPAYLKARWVYSLDLPSIGLAPTMRTLACGGLTYVALEDLAQANGYQVFQDPRGLVLLSRQPVTFSTHDTVLMDNIVTLFDTPSKLADPDIATRSIPTLRAQGKWTEHVKVTQEQLNALSGPELHFAGEPDAHYDYSGFNAALLGSKPPAPGVYPRLLFSPDDLPALRSRMQGQKLAQKTLREWELLFRKTWWNPSTSDGQVFQKLTSDTAYATLAWAKNEKSPGAGVLRSLFDGQKPGLTTSHVNYNTNSLTSMALYCLLSGDETHGRQAATALANYFRLLEPLLDAHLATSDSQWGVSSDAAGNSETGWRGMHGTVMHMDLAFALDFGGRWMSAEQKDFMRRFIAKATYGRLDNMQAAPARQRDINHMTWHLTQYLAVSAIEGLEGSDPEVLATGVESAKAFLDWGIDDHGYIFESNGKSGGGLQFQLLSMVVAERRGAKLWGHPHFRKLLTAQVHATSPNGRNTVSSGTWGGGPLSASAIDIIKAFYPEDLAADYLLNLQLPELSATSLDLGAHASKLASPIHGVRLPGPTSPGFVFNGLYDTDWKPVSRAELKLPTDFVTPSYGFLSASSNATPEAAWLALHVRSNQYIGSGHHHADVGMFYFSALGVDWITESPFRKSYDGKYHNQVLIDGISEPDGLPARGTYLGDTIRPEASFASVDQTQSYTWRWTNQVLLWDNIPESDIWGRTARIKDWSLSPDPLALAVYRGTQHRKSRPWWPSYTFSNWMPVVQAPWNPVHHAFRTAGLVRGAHAYGLVVDDLRKDDGVHLYTWTAMLGEGVTDARLPGLASHQVALARAADMSGGTLHAGAPLLLVHAFDKDGALSAKVETARDGEVDPRKGPQPYDRVALDLRAKQANFRVLLIPLRMGEPPPGIQLSSDGLVVTIEWTDQKDSLVFASGADNRTRVTLHRGETTVVLP
jgi:hypothetical protein